MAETTKKAACTDAWRTDPVNVKKQTKTGKTAASSLPSAKSAGVRKRPAAGAATRKPDMSHPVSRVEKPQIVIGSVPKENTDTGKQGLLSKVLTGSEPSVRTVAAKQRKPFPVSLVLCTMLCFTLFMYMILNYVRINECSVRLSEIEARIAEAEKTEQELSLELEKRNDLTEIARIAEEDLGMVKLDEISKIHLNSLVEDKIELTEAAKEPENERSVLSVVMSAVSRIFGESTEYSE